MVLFDLQAFSILRTSGRTLSAVTGKWDAGTTATIAATGNIQPAGAKDLEMLPEGERTAEVVVVVSDTAMYPADIISYGGKQYKVLIAESYDAGASPLILSAHHQAICTKKKE